MWYVNPTQCKFFWLFEFLHPWPKGAASVEAFCVFCQFPMNLNSFAVINHKISQAHLAHFQLRTWNPLCLLGTFVPFNGKWNSFPIIWLPACSFCHWFYAFQLLRNETLLGINLRNILRLYKYFQFKWMLTGSIFKDCFFSFEVSLCEIFTDFKIQTYPTRCIER